MYRGVPSNQLPVIVDKYESACPVYLSGFTSATVDVSVAKRFAGPGGVIFRIKVCNGRKVCYQRRYSCTSHISSS